MAMSGCYCQLLTVICIVQSEVLHLGKQEMKVGTRLVGPEDATSHFQLGLTSFLQYLWILRF
jgi:hypothetical protein